ncbi:unnamed protein product [Diamesa tonsa]
MSAGVQKPCDDINSESLTFDLPIWYDEHKFKRGQRYFFDNRFGMMTSNLYGLFSLLCDPRGSQFLDRTGKSSDKISAKKRYASTTQTMLNWYKIDFEAGSKSWESLKRVRKMHLLATQASLKKGNQMIVQSEMALTQFGFMGYALVRPHLLGIKHDNTEDRESFVHFWAVVGCMLGIEDQFNMCLFELDVVEIICIRYIFIPLIQLETPVFHKLVSAFIEGMKNFVPFSSYESRLFLAKRLLGVPGYQYDVDLTKEYYCKTLFTAEEFQNIAENINHDGAEYRKNYLFSEKMCVLHIQKLDSYQHLKSDDNSTLENEDDSNEFPGIFELLQLNHYKKLIVTQIDVNQIKNYLNDNKFKEMSKKDQFLVKLGINQSKMLKHKISNYISETGLSVILFMIEKFLKNN